MRRTLVLLAAATCLASAACGEDKPCAKPTKAAGPCADLTFQNRSYDEWRVVHPRGILQEVGDAFYPACNKADQCGGDPLLGKGATDVWQYDGLDATKAVIGLRQDTHTYVVFVRVGLDPDSLSADSAG